MLPSIAAVGAIELLRDGGSLSATFAGPNGAQYGLLMQVILEHGPDGGLIQRGYERPVVFERVEFREADKIGWQGVNEVELSWSHASILLHQMKPLVRDEPDARCLEMMLESVRGEGALPEASRG